MDRVHKVLTKLTEKERRRVEELIKAIQSDDTSHLDIKKLKKYPDFYRVRSGNIRIIYKSNKSNNRIVRVVAVERRSEGTYKF